MITTFYNAPSGYLVDWVSRGDRGSLLIRLSGHNVYRIYPDSTAPELLGDMAGTTWCGDINGKVARADLGGVLLSPCQHSIVHRSSTARLTRIAGDATAYGFSGDGGFALDALFTNVRGLVVAPHRDLYAVVDGTGGSPRIRHLMPPIPTTANGVLRVPSADAMEIYEFSVRGRHLRTLSALRGIARYTFGYDASTNELTSVTDEAGNVTQFAHAPGSITVTAPHGQTTTLALDANGYLASVTNPLTTEITQVAHSALGLLTGLTDARGNAHQFAYDAEGRLTKDVNAEPGSLGTRVVTTMTTSGWTAEIQSPEGRTTQYTVDRSSLPDNAFERRQVVRSGLTSTTDRYLDGATKTTSPDGTVSTRASMAADPRFGTLAPYSTAVQVDVGYPTATHSYSRSESRSATVANPQDPFSVTAETLTSTVTATGVAAATTTRAFTAGPPAKWTTTSPEGRQLEETLDAQDRITQVAILGASPVQLYPVQYHYDALGRVDQITHGTRVYGTTYNGSSGWIDATTAPETLGVTFNTRDADGRATLVTLPGARQVSTSYDLGGNVLSVTPPGKPSHGFTWNETNRLGSYAPPQVTPAIGSKDTGYFYDTDGLAQFVTNPGMPATYAYDALGRTKTITDAVTKTFGYDAQGRLQTISTSDGVTLTNTFDGSLLAQQQTTGPFSATLTKSYDNLLRVSSWNVNAGTVVSVAYDRDNLVTSSGGMTVTRSSNGLLTDTTLGVLTDHFDYTA